MRIGGEWFDSVTEEAVADRVLAALDRGMGGRIVTPNVDILRIANGRGALAREVRAILVDATILVADGMPLVWASRLAGTPLPERVTGSGLIWTLSTALGRERRSIFVLGGSPAPMYDGAQRAAAALAASCPGIQIAGHHAPQYGFECEPSTYDSVLCEVIDAKPDFVFVGLGFPKQERVISHLRPYLPESWFLGCGAAIGFVAGEVKRAPFWMQRSGLEWAHRMAQEPRRLAGRYLAHDAPYAMKLLARAVTQRRR